MEKVDYEKLIEQDLEKMENTIRKMEDLICDYRKFQLRLKIATIILAAAAVMTIIVTL